MILPLSMTAAAVSSQDDSIPRTLPGGRDAKAA
jgi:hypothetical protein